MQMGSIRKLMVKMGRWLLLGERAGMRQSIHGNGNIFQGKDVLLNNVELDVIGDGNQVLFGRGGSFTNVHIRLRGSGHHIEFGENCRISRGATFWFEDEKCLLQVGSNTTMVDVHIAVTESGSRVVIGEDCMLANDIDIRTGDTHAIIDLATGQRLNQAGDVILGNHVWVAPHVVILKGVSIGANSIVATGSVVTRSFGSGVISAGNPARIIKTGVSWSRSRTGPSMQSEIITKQF
jgi:acetyltransferase-like isoleucine patch superfamily enzyme